MAPRTHRAYLHLISLNYASVTGRMNLVWVEYIWNKIYPPDAPYVKTQLTFAKSHFKKYGWSRLTWRAKMARR
jgi:hypothetical protein